MKVFSVAVKAVVLICAGAVGVLRLVWYKYYTVLPEATLGVINTVSYVCVAVLIVFALIWIMTEKSKK